MPMSLDANSDVFLFGASTAPYAKSMDWPMEEWDQDLRTMRKLNFNTARVFAAWDRIERREGEFDFSKQDRFMELAAVHGIKVVLQFGGLFGNPCGIYQPSWLSRDPACRCWEKSPGVFRAPPNQICPDDPTHLRKAMAFMERTVTRYAECERIVAWMIWNEPDRREYCYCPHTQALFRTWLAEKYGGDLERLNRTWGTEHPMDHECWEDVRAPLDGHAVNPWRDWLAFNQFRLCRTANDICDMVAVRDPHGRPTTANIVYHHASHEDGMTGPRLGMDVGGWGQALGVMGVSCYTIAHPWDVRPAFETAYKLSWLRTASRDPERRTLVLETEAGPYVRMITDRQRHQRFWQLIAHNAKSILLWNYRSRLSDGQASYFHLLRWDGSISRRARAIGDFAGMLQRHAKVLNRVYPQRVAAVLATEEQQLLSSSYHGGGYVGIHDSRLGAYKLLWDMNIPTDCLTEHNLGDVGTYKVVLLPMVENMTPALAGCLREYAEGGGTIIAESPFAFKDGDNFLQYRTPAFNLDELFGGWTCDREGVETAPDIICPEGMAKAHFFWHEFELGGGEALATYEGGSPAVIGRRFGRGRAVLAGTEVFRQYLKNPQSAMTALLRKEVLDSSASPTARVRGEAADVEVCRLSGPGGLVYLVINHNARPVSVELELSDPGEWIDMEDGRCWKFPASLRIEPETAIALMRAEES